MKPFSGLKWPVQNNQFPFVIRERKLIILHQGAPWAYKENQVKWHVNVLSQKPRINQKILHNENMVLGLLVES